MHRDPPKGKFHFKPEQPSWKQDKRFGEALWFVDVFLRPLVRTPGQMAILQNNHVSRVQWSLAHQLSKPCLVHS